MLTNSVKIAVMVSGGGTNLQALIDAEASCIIKSGKISLVLSNKSDAYALTRAEKAGIPTAVVEKKACVGVDFEDKLIETLDAAGIEIIVLAGFMSILSEKFTSHYSNRIINVHPSLIPSFCGKGFYGLKVHEAALAYGVKVRGATVHFVNEIPDGGKIIMQRAVSVMDGDTPEILQRRIMEEAEWKILPLSCEKVCSEILKNKKGN
jgi:phosphoribosylglycinamide formyltransferase-1